MKKVVLSIAILFWVANVGFTNEIFVSFTGFGGSTAATANTSAEFEVGDLGSAFVWIDPSTDIDTLAVTNILLSNASVIALTGSEVFNPDIVLISDSSDVGDRWDTVDNGTPTVTGDAISGMLGFANLSGTGVLMSQDGTGTQLDDLFDPLADAFLFARIDFVANTPGVVDVNPDGILLNGGQLDDFNVSGATVTVVPEPSAAVLALATATICFRRRR